MAVAWGIIYMAKGDHLQHHKLFMGPYVAAIHDHPQQEKLLQMVQETIGGMTGHYAYS